VNSSQIEAFHGVIGSVATRGLPSRNMRSHAQAEKRKLWTDDKLCVGLPSVLKSCNNDGRSLRQENDPLRRTLVSGLETKSSWQAFPPSREVSEQACPMSLGGDTDLWFFARRGPHRESVGAIETVDQSHFPGTSSCIESDQLSRSNAHGSSRVPVRTRRRTFVDAWRVASINPERDSPLLPTARSDRSRDPRAAAIRRQASRPAVHSPACTGWRAVRWMLKGN